MTALSRVIAGVSLLVISSSARADDPARERGLAELRAGRPKAAAKLLTEALRNCRKACTTAERGFLLRALGAAQVNSGKQRAGERTLQRAVKLDPLARLERRLTTPAVKAAFEAVGGITSALLHIAVHQQRRNTPIPIYVDVLIDASQLSLSVYYKTVRARRWRRTTMRRHGDGFAATIGCADVRGQSAMLYRIVARRHGEIYESSARKAQPHRVELVANIDGDAPTLPGADPEARCQSQRSRKAEPEDQQDPEGPLLSLSIGFEQDVAWLGAADACSQEAEANHGRFCFREQGDQYLGRPTDTPGNEVSPGAALSTSRVILGAAVPLGAWRLGGRVGFAFGGGPEAANGSTFLPLHGEVRGEYHFSLQSVRQLDPYALGRVALAQEDATAEVRVREDRSAPTSQANPDQQSLDFVHRRGPIALGLGAGVGLPLGAVGGPYLEASMVLRGPVFGVSVAPHVGWLISL